MTDLELLLSPNCTRFHAFMRTMVVAERATLTGLLHFLGMKYLDKGPGDSSSSSIAQLPFKWTPS